MTIRETELNSAGAVLRHAGIEDDVTPKPWRVVPGQHTARGSIRCDIVSDGAPFSPAFVAGDILPLDARLMSAAPEMLAALEGILEWCALEERYGREALPVYDRDAARAAIQKAKGAA